MKYSFCVSSRNNCCSRCIADKLPTNPPLPRYNLPNSYVCMFAPKCWDLKRSDYHLIETFNKKVLRWSTGMHDYREAVIASNLLPPLYLKVLKDLLLFSKIMSGNYDVDFSIFYEINWSAYRIRVKLLEIPYEAQRHNFWYRTGFRVNVLLRRNLHFSKTTELKSNLSTLMWDFFRRNCNSSNPCSWIYLYLCSSCRTNPML